MTTKLTDEERAKLDRVEQGPLGHMNQEAKEQHFRGIRDAATARAKRESAGHPSDCECWACLYLAGLEEGTS